MANYTKIKVEKRYTDVSMIFIEVENKAKNIYIELKAWYYETYSSWGHKAYIYARIGDSRSKRSDFKCRYYNRTWENYQFQSVLREALYGCGVKADKKLLDNLWKRIDAKARYA